MNIRKAKRDCNIQRWKSIIEDRNASSLTVKEYCQRNGLSRDAYFYWLRIIRQELLKAAESTELQCTNSSRFVELTESRESLQAPSSPNDPSDAASEIILSLNGVTMRVSESTSPALLARTLEVIRNA